jgi:hypothetical protein
MTFIHKVTYMVSMDTVVDEAMLQQVMRVGFSRIPICKNGNRNLIIGILLTKSLLGVDPNKGLTVKDLFLAKRVQVRVPLYIHREAALGKMVKAMQTGHSHMAIVLHSAAAASELRNLAEEYHRKITATPSTSPSAELRLSMNETEDADAVDGESEVVGIVTLENVIERILLTDIHDEKDRQANKLLKDRLATFVYNQEHANDPDFKPRTSAIGTASGDVFRSRFVSDYYNVLHDELARALSKNDQNREDFFKPNFGGHAMKNTLMEGSNQFNISMRMDDHMTTRD